MMPPVAIANILIQIPAILAVILAVSLRIPWVSRHLGLDSAEATPQYLFNLARVFMFLGSVIFATAGIIILRQNDTLSAHFQPLGIGILVIAGLILVTAIFARP
jgi:hypothetical protein